MRSKVPSSWRRKVTRPSWVRASYAPSRAVHTMSTIGSRAASSSTSRAASASVRWASGSWWGLVGAVCAMAPRLRGGAVRRTGRRALGCRIPRRAANVSGSAQLSSRAFSLRTHSEPPALGTKVSSCAYIQPESRRHHARVARDRCRGRDPRSARHRDRHPPARQAQAHLGAAPRLRRPRCDRERGRSWRSASASCCRRRITATAVTRVVSAARTSSTCSVAMRRRS